MATAIYPGTFDPVTLGHVDIIRRASRLFDRLVIGILVNKRKQPLFSLEERMEMLREVLTDLPNVEVSSFEGLQIDFCRQVGAEVIVRGLRTPADFEFELVMAQSNRKLCDDIETLFLTTDARYSYMSSSSVRELIAFGAPVRGFVPEKTARRIEDKFYRQA
ncbi:MAG: pantetheine-phosphate adenylyltransferase [Eubacterium sp.]|nr:pantetheine-phosphate adenylyltransferase [Eubacterium sp.]